MKRAFFIALAAWALVLGAPFAQGDPPFDETKLTLRSEMLRMINRDRAAYGLPPLQLDAEASAVADAYCRDQIRNGTTGHFTTDGLSPYMRYSFAGGNDAVSENAAAWSAAYRFSDRALYEMMRRSEEAMMRERPPHDGHRRAILDPYATHVGIGLAWEHGEFRIAQEFVRRYVTWKKPLPRAATMTDTVVATARPLPGYQVEAISVHYEPSPRTLAAPAANNITSYRLPSKRRDLLPRLRSHYERRDDGALVEVREEYAGGSRGDFPVASDGTFSVTVPFNEGPGVYTVVVWVRGANDRTPISASTVSIRAESPAGRLVYAGIGTR